LYNYHEKLKSLLSQYQVNPSQIKIEITENIAMYNETYTVSQISKLKNLGIKISLDDFGTGYSSFSMIESLPIDTLKIDKSFILDITKNKDHQTITNSMIAMAHALGIKVIAEGIENQESAELLQNFGCDYLQGYHLGRPMPVFEFQKLIRQQDAILDSNDIIPIL